jgi:DNA repair exonuclease SbcCD ATPase subunit
MANPILKSDLIEEGLQQELDKLLKTITDIGNGLTGLRGGVTQYAQSMNEAVRGTHDNAEEMTKMAARISQLEDYVKKLSAAERENNNARKAVNAEKRKYAKLTAEEAASVKRLSDNIGTYTRLANSQAQSLKGLTEVYAKNIVEIDTQKKSYNELYATYNAIKDVLNKMTVEERANTEAGKALTAQAKQIRDTMNELQQSTGVYTLNVGNYMSAMSGLQMQTQQLLREIPSAQNLQQFFLAISNNIPMFTDALMRYNKGIPEIKVKLAGVRAEIAKQNAEMANLNVQSAEYAAKQVQINELKKQEIQLQSMTQSGWKAILKSVFSWQTAIIAGLIILRKIPDWIKSIKEKWDRWKNGVKEVHNEVDGITASIRLQADAVKKYASTAAQLDLIIYKMSEIDQGTEKWATGVRMINDLTGQTKAKEDDNLTTLKEITEEYKKQAKQIAINNVLGEMYEQNIRNEMLRKQGYNIYGKYKNASEMATAAAQLYGISLDSKEYKNLETLYEDQIKATNEYYKAKNKGYDAVRKSSGAASVVGAVESDKEVKERITKAKKDAEQAVTNFINKYTEMYTEQELQELAKKEFDLVDPLKEPKGPGGPKGRTYTEKDITDRTWEVMEARARMIQDEQKREEALQEAANQKAIQQNDKTWETQKEHLAFNLEHKFITLDEYNEQMEQAERDHDLISQGLEEENQQKLMEIWHKYDEKRQEAIRKSEKDQIEAIIKYGELQQKAVRRRVKSISDEKERNSELLHNVRELEATIKRLNAQSLTDPESIDKRADEVDKLTKKIEKLKNELAFDKQLTNYGSLWDVFQRNGAFEASQATKREMLRGLLGNIVDELDDEQIASNFEKYLDTMKDTAKTWYTTTKDYINELIDAYVELANAKADAAKEATDAAQEEYEKEKALLEAGYANRVETMWSEYQQKKAIQEQAEADAKAAAAAQKQLSEIETAGSLITASANIWKAFGQWPPLAIAAIATMWGSFLAAKAKAMEVSQYGEGDVQVVGGGSHASGHDTLLGYSLQGKEMRVENGEVVGIIPRRSVRRLGEQNVLNTMRALRDGTFEANAVKMMDINRNAGNIMFPAYGKVDLSKVERSLSNIENNGNKQTFVDAQGNIIVRSNSGTTKYMRR